MRYLVVPAILVVGLGYGLRAQDAGKERERGKVLLLKTGHAMEGDIEKLGLEFCVRRGKSEVRIAVEKAVRLCADWDDAYAYAQTLIKPDDANDHVKLARWCHLHRLTNQALAEARRALQLQPDNGDAKQIVVLLERMAKDPAPKPAPVAIDIPQPIVNPTPTVDVSFETLIGFTNGVQPILMNTCATCHSTGNGGKFHLDRVSDNTKKVGTQRNLAAVLAFVDLERPSISPLLVRAITPHGGALAPAIKDRSAKPAQSIQQWIEQTVAKNPQLKDYYGARKPMTPLPVKTGVGSGFAAPPVKDAKPPIPNVVTRGVSQQETPAAQPAPAVQPAAPLDQWDAELFNRQFHPRR
ncbi:MAG: hypothetical protein EXR98_01335 [Gemmataceae bacterium]|nr:hypothetical protein [Gemmataceae bacterium]